MKKVNVDLMLGKKTRSHFRHYGPKTTIVAAEMPVEIAIKTSTYGLRFGKSGLNSTEICDKFNIQSALDWLKGLKIPVAFFLSATKIMKHEEREQQEAQEVRQQHQRKPSTKIGAHTFILAQEKKHPKKILDPGQSENNNDET